METKQHLRELHDINDTSHMLHLVKAVNDSIKILSYYNESHENINALAEVNNILLELIDMNSI